MNMVNKLIALIIAVGCMSVARGDPIIVTNQADFFSHESNVANEGFESFPGDGNCTDGGSTISTSLLSVTSLPQAGGTSWLCVGTTVAGFPGPTEGNNALVAGSNTGDPFILSFVLNEAAQGVYFELTDAVERGDAFISFEGMNPILVASQGTGGLNTVSFGIIFDSPITAFNLINTGLYDGWGVDNMILALVHGACNDDYNGGDDEDCDDSGHHHSVPEPATLALFGLGLVGIGFSRRKKA